MEQRKITEREDPRVLRTRHLLLQAFSDLYTAKGFQAMTVQDITERAGVNRGTFYSHFEDKYAILEEWLREQFQQHVARPVLRSGPWSLSTFPLLIQNVVQNVVEWFAQLHQSTRSYDRSLIPLVVTTLQEALFELLRQGMSSAAGAGLNRQGDLETVAMVASWAIFGTGFQCLSQWDEQTVVLPPEELANKVTSVLMRGIAQTLPAFPPT